MYYILNIELYNINNIMTNTGLNRNIKVFSIVYKCFTSVWFYIN